MAGRKLLLIHLIVVPRMLPLQATKTKESEQGDSLLQAALQIARWRECTASPEILQVREAESALLDEISDFHCAILLLRAKRTNSGNTSEFVPTLSTILAQATCSIWLIVDLPMLS